MYIYIYIVINCQSINKYWNDEGPLCSPLNKKIALTCCCLLEGFD